RGRPDALGSTLKLNETPFTIVGVGPAPFRGMNLAQSIDMWIPMAPDNGPDSRENRGLNVVGRLGASATLAQAQEQLTALAARLARDYPKSNLGTLDRPREA